MEAIIFVGIQGSGKSTFFKERFFDSHIALILICCGQENREKMLFEAVLKRNKSLVLDKTNLTREESENTLLAQKVSRSK
jgi:predicted kinase